MSTKNSPKYSDTTQPTLFHISENAPKSARATYKGGRELRCAIRFELWRSTEGLSLTRIASKLTDKVLKLGINEGNVLKALYRFEQGRHKPPTWLILLLMQTYQIHFPWEDFLD